MPTEDSDTTGGEYFLTCVTACSVGLRFLNKHKEIGFNEVVIEVILDLWGRQ